MGRVALFLVAALLWTALHAADMPPSDIATTRNGDVHSGMIDRGPFVLDTDYGELRLPLWFLREIHFGANGAPDRIVTVRGDRLSGEMRPFDFTVQRVLGAPLVVHSADLAELRFAERSSPESKQPFVDVVELRDGDLLQGRLVNSSWKLHSDGKTFEVDRAPGTRIDVAGWEDEYRVRVVPPDGGARQAEPAFADVVLRFPGDQRLVLPLEKVEAVGFGIQRDVSSPPYLLVRNGAADGAFRDRLRGGEAGPAMQVVAAGRYRRGPVAGGGDANEQPVREVVIEQAFAIGVFEVTFDDYAAFCADTGRSLPDDSGWGRGRRPAVNVSWDDASAYAAWLSRKTGHPYRLPTEAEWEYAARAGTVTRYWWGDEVGADMANCMGCGSLWDGETTALVGRFSANGFGLYDTVGNVWEWVADCYEDGYEKAPVDGTAFDQEPCGKRVIRGGAWSFPPEEARSASRWRDFPSRSSDDTGFRLVRELTESERHRLLAGR